jgi:hypothetical protein
MDETIHQAVAETSEALDYLIAQGLIEEMQNASSGRLYRLNERRLEDAKKLIQSE